jgi:aldose sugar dehydrogenase
MTGPDEFNRVVRVHLNTLENLPLFLPLLWIFAFLWGDVWGGIFGGTWVLGRLLYAWGYYRAVALRTCGFGIASSVVLLLLVGCAYGLIRGLVPPAAAQGFDPAKVDWEKLSKIPMQDFFIKKFNDSCASCHGEDLRGTTLGTPLVGNTLRHGASVQEIAASIATGFPDAGMPKWSETLDETQIWNLALYVAEQRQGTTILDKRDKIAFRLPAGVIETEKASFRVETVATGIAAMPFAMAPLPDGRILVTERLKGLRVLSRDGRLSAPVTGTPPVYADIGMFLGQVNGLGWMLDVALHPNYRRNGWIYLQHTDRCTDCNAQSRKTRKPVSLNRLIRGRLKAEGDGYRWVDQQVLWQGDAEAYTDTSDLAAGGRIAFDGKGHVYFTVGMKAALDIMGVQDLKLPYGKVHRLHDDGRVPRDNPFVGVAGAVPSIWTYGHRSLQGLHFDRATRQLWSTEMGPRGGDELNLLGSGGNYGWPVFTNGINYDGRPVDGAKKLGITLAAKDTVFPVLDLTPAQGISDLLVYRGKEFPQWKGSLLIGTLRATDLLRVEVADGRVVHTEVLLKDLARFRDVALGARGELYLLIENAAGSQILRLSPVDRSPSAP